MIKELIIGVALATCVSSVAIAEVAAPYKILPPVDFSVMTDTAYNVTTETASTEFGVVAGYEGVEIALLPVYDWDSAEISDIQLSAAYTYEITSAFALVPYGEYHVDKDMTEVSKIVGIKTIYKF